MSNVANSEDLKPMSLSKVGIGTVTDFDLYINIGGLMVLYAPKPYHWSQSEIDRLIGDGHGELFYQTKSESQVKVYRELCQIPEVDTSKSPEEQIQDIVKISSEFSKILFTHEFTEASLLRGKKVAGSLLDCVQEKPTCIKALSTLSKSDDYTFLHSGRVAAYTVAIALEMSMNDERDLENIALGCLLHDLGKAKIEKSLLQKPGPLTRQERHQIEQHPQMGLEMIGGAELSVVPSEIILHHHEREDGGGYPHGLSKAELLTEVKIAAFSDVFDALTSSRPYQKKRGRYEALDFIRFNLIDHVYSDAYKALVSLLGSS